MVPLAFHFPPFKDMFERYYKHHLARRLLLNKSSSDEAESGLLARLKVSCCWCFGQPLFALHIVAYHRASGSTDQRILLLLSSTICQVECGATFTQKLEGMFRDMALSNGLAEAFSRYMKSVRPSFRLIVAVSEKRSPEIFGLVTQPA